MAVFQQELKWSTYQDKQLKVLESLEKSFNSSLQISLNINRSLTSVAAAVDALARNTLANFNNASRRSSQILLDSAGNVSKATTQQTEAASAFTDILKENRKILDQYGNTIVDLTRKHEKAIAAAEAQKEKEKKRKREAEEHWNLILSESKRIISDISNAASQMVDQVSKDMDKYSNLNNSLMRNTGLSNSQSQRFRDDLTYGIVSELNRDTGNYYNSQEVMGQMVAIANQTGIGNIDVLEEITRPTMLAQESMNVNIGEISTLLSKWSTRYNFSSLAMEEMVNDIRSSSAGNQSTAEASLRNTLQVENWIAYYSKGNEELMSAMTEDLANFTAYGEAMGIDTNRYANYFKKIYSGEAANDNMLVTLLGRAGYSTMDAQKILSSGNEGALSEIGLALMEAEAGLFEDLTGEAGSNIVGLSSSAYGTDVENLVDVYNALNQDNRKTYEEFLATKDGRTAAEAIEEMNISIKDQVVNRISKFTSTFAKWQEDTGIYLSDIAFAVGTAWILQKGAFSFANSIVKMMTGGQSILQLIGSAIGIGGSAAGGGAVLGGTVAGGTIISALGPIAAIAAAVAAIAVTITSIAASVEMIEDISNKTFDKTFGNEATIDNLTSGDQLVWSREMSQDANGNWVENWSMKGISTDEYEQNKEYYDQLQKDYLNSTIDDVQPRNFWGKFSDLATSAGPGNWAKAAGYMLGNKKLIEFGRKYSTSLQDDILYNEDKFSYATAQDIFNRSISTNPDYLETYQAYLKAGIATDQDSLLELITNILEKDLANKLLKEKKVLINGEWYDTSEVPAFVSQGYENGSNYIPSNQVAYLHEGEAVVPKKYNPSANLTELEMLRERDKEKDKAENNQTQEVMRATLNTLVEIKEFLSQWQTDNIRREDLAEARSKFDRYSDWVASYQGT